MQLNLQQIYDAEIRLTWQARDSEDCTYRLYWSDRYSETMEYRCVYEGKNTCFTLEKATHIPHYLKVQAWRDGELLEESPLLKTPVKKVFHEQLEQLNRGLIAIATKEGVFLSWRMFLEEVTGYTETGMSGTDYVVYKNGKRLVLVTDSTNYLDREGTLQDTYSVAAVHVGGKGAGQEKREGCLAGGDCGESAAAAGRKESACEGETACAEDSPCEPVHVSPNEYIEIPMQIPEGGVTPAGEAYTYSANDMSVGDVDGDGEYEFFVKWDPSNAHDVSGKGYTGKCFIDCYKLSGRLLWRLDMGVNIRAGAHYTQFMVYDFDGDGKAEMSVKTAPGTCMTIYNEDGTVRSKKHITLPEEDAAKGVTHEDNYVCSADDYYRHIVKLFQGWQELPEVKSGQWPATLEECFSMGEVPARGTSAEKASAGKDSMGKDSMGEDSVGGACEKEISVKNVLMEKKYEYPLSQQDAEALADYFIDVYAPSRSKKMSCGNLKALFMKGRSI